jgi:hypothetical protein
MLAWEAHTFLLHEPRGVTALLGFNLFWGCCASDIFRLLRPSYSKTNENLGYLFGDFVRARKARVCVRVKRYHFCHQLSYRVTGF